jgi:2-C-methyl-D-erythritol 2,4-cyclodiphosphate synthase
VRGAGWKLVNLDCVVTCERPKVLPHRDAIRASLAEALEVDASAVFVKGKTNEKVDAIGGGLAVDATAVCLLERD